MVEFCLVVEEGYNCLCLFASEIFCGWCGCWDDELYERTSEVSCGSLPFGSDTDYSERETIYLYQPRQERLYV